MPETTEPTTEEPSGDGPVARKVYATEHAAEVITMMTERLGLWSTRIDAALFLAALAVHHDRPPVPDEDLGPGSVTIGNLSSAVQGIDEAGELTLFKIVAEDPDAKLDTVLREDLKGLIEAGAEIIEPELDGRDPAGSVAELATLVQASE